MYYSNLPPIKTDVVKRAIRNKKLATKQSERKAKKVTKEPK